MPAKTKINKDLSTEEKIKEAARKIFTQKGYAATRTRDIAEAAGINLALLNYYFRSKDKLFEIVMLEKVQQLFGAIYPIITDQTTKLETKLELIAETYIEMLSGNPDLPIFVLSELRNNIAFFSEKFKVTSILRESHLIRQLQEKRPDVNPLHFFMNTLAMMIFPFVMKIVFDSAGVVDEKQFSKMMQERKKLIPIWVKAMLKAKIE